MNGIDTTEGTGGDGNYVDYFVSARSRSPRLAAMCP